MNVISSSRPRNLSRGLEVFTRNLESFAPASRLHAFEKGTIESVLFYTRRLLDLIVIEKVHRKC